MGRKCRYPGCKTILSSYNSHSACLAHTIKFFDLITDRIEYLESKLHHLQYIKSKDRARMVRIKRKIKKLEIILDK